MSNTPDPKGVFEGDNYEEKMKDLKVLAEKIKAHSDPKQALLDSFDGEFVATGADIDGMKRVEYRQLRERQVEQVKAFISHAFDLGKSLGYKEGARAVIEDIPDSLGVNHSYQPGPLGIGIVIDFKALIKDQLKSKYSND